MVKGTDIIMNIKEIERKHGFQFIGSPEERDGELYLDVRSEDFRVACHALHKELKSPVKMLFAEDDGHRGGNFRIYCGFEAAAAGKWVFVRLGIPKEKPQFPSLAKEIFSASLFEREIFEMFGIEPECSPDKRRLRLHDEVWPAGAFPLRKDFSVVAAKTGELGVYKFKRIEGAGIMEVAVGPVHAGIIGPGHFRFSVAGEPVINLEIRLGFAHRGVEKMLEGKQAREAVSVVECVSGDSPFANSLAFANAVERICGVKVPKKAEYLRAIFLELERMHNHILDAGTLALDAAYSFPHAYAQVMKEFLLVLNEKLTGSRYLKGVCAPGGVLKDISKENAQYTARCMDALLADLKEFKAMIFSSASFMDRLETTGTLGRNAAEDLGVSGLAARASGIDLDLRQDFPGVWHEAGFSAAKENFGDALARLKIRIKEFEASAGLVKQFAGMLKDGEMLAGFPPKQGYALGFSEGCRGPVLYWVRLGAGGAIERCKIVDASFNNWQGLAYSLPGNIVPDFPLCNKSFNLSYPGNDL